MKNALLRLLMVVALSAMPFFATIGRAQCDCSEATYEIIDLGGYQCHTTVHIYSTVHQSGTAHWQGFYNPATAPLTFENGMATFVMTGGYTFSIQLDCNADEHCWLLQNYTPDWTVHSPAAQFASVCGVPNSTVEITDTDDNCLPISVYAVQNEPPYHSFNTTVPAGGSITVPSVPPGTYTATLSCYVYFGNYWVTSTQTFEVKGAPTATFQKDRPTCFGDSDGALKCNPKPLLGGTGYTYLWNTGATTREINNIPAGNYSVTMTQIATGCTGSASVELTEPTQLATSLTTIHNKCLGQSQGRVVSIPSGGSSTKTHLWSTGSTSNKIQDLAPGTYTVTVTDSKGCTTSAEATVTEPSALTLSHTVETLPNGKFRITLTGAGGTPYPTGSPYKYCRVSATGSCGFTTNNLYTIPAAGTYTFRARDKNGCEVSIDVILPPTFGSGGADERSGDWASTGFALSPNPFANQLIVNASQPLGDELQARVLDATGRLISEKTWPAGTDKLTFGDTSTWPSGVFFIQITDAENTVRTSLKAVKTD